MPPILPALLTSPAGSLCWGLIHWIEENNGTPQVVCKTPEVQGLPADVRAQRPDGIVLKVATRSTGGPVLYGPDSMEVEMRFSGRMTRVTIPYNAIMAITIEEHPNFGLDLSFIRMFDTQMAKYNILLQHPAAMELFQTQRMPDPVLGREQDYIDQHILGLPPKSMEAPPAKAPQHGRGQTPTHVHMDESPVQQSPRKTGHLRVVK